MNNKNNFKVWIAKEIIRYILYMYIDMDAGIYGPHYYLARTHVLSSRKVAKCVYIWIQIQRDASQIG